MKRVLNWGVFVLVILGAFLIAGPTALGGPATYVIVDGTSMEPTYKDGDLVVARQGDGYEVGDVIVYDAPIDTQFEVIHRVIAPTEGGYRTQGDNRDEPDGWIAPHETIHGAAVLHVPYGGKVVTFLRQPAAIFGLVAGFVVFDILKRAEQRRKAEAARIRMRETVEP